MLSAIVLLKVEPKRINEIAQRLVDIDRISEVYSVGGRFDLVAIIRAKESDEIADIVTSRLLGIDGIVSTETLIAFKVFSKHDLERMFSIGEEA